MPDGSGIPSFAPLDVSDTTVSDDGMKFVGMVSGLKDVDLPSTNFSDKGLPYVEGLNMLYTAVLLPRRSTEPFAAQKTPAMIKVFPYTNQGFASNSWK